MREGYGNVIARQCPMAIDELALGQRDRRAKPTNGNAPIRRDTVAR
jgi:hypothetical protein